MSGRQGVGEAAATMRLRDRKSGAGVLGDITNKKEVSKSSQSGASKARSKRKSGESSEALTESGSLDSSEDKENGPPPRRRSSRGGGKEIAKVEQPPLEVAPGKTNTAATTKPRVSLGAMDVDEDENEENIMRSNALKAADEALKRKSTSKKGEAATGGFAELVLANDNKTKKKFGRRQSRSTNDSSDVFDEATTIVSVDPPPAPPVQSKAKGLKRRKSGGSGGEGAEEDKENVDPAPAPKRAAREPETAPAFSAASSSSSSSSSSSAAQDAVTVVSNPPTEGHAPVDNSNSMIAVAAAEAHTRAAAAPAAVVAEAPAAAQPVHFGHAGVRFHRPSILRLRTKNSDPAHCLDMIDDMYDIYFGLEDQYAAKPYMDSQDDINRKMRAILVDWMVEVHSRFKLQTTTLWLSVNILDRYLMNMKVVRAKLQLVGISSMLIACKYEEQAPPEVQDCVVITDYAYGREELLDMEKNILIALNYDIMVPTGYTFLSRYLNAVNATDSTRHLASYYAERNLQEIDSLQQAPHHVAAAAIFAANVQQSQNLTFYACHLENWSEALELESGMQERELLPYARTMVKHVGEETETASKRRLTACKTKFSSAKFGEVGKFRLPKIPAA